MNKYGTLVELIQSKESFGNDRGITFISGENDVVFVPYEELYLKSLSLLYNLQAKGLSHGDELIFQLEDNESFVYTFWACILGGIIPVPVSVGHNEEHRLKLFNIWKVLKKPYMICDQKTFSALNKFSNGKDISDTFEIIRDKILFIEDIRDNQASLLGNIYESNPQNIAFIQFSSGSTGDPKGVVLTHENLIANTKAFKKAIAAESHDNMLSWMPLTHDMGLIAFHLTSTLADANQYLMKTSVFISHPTLWLDKATQHRGTVLYSPNFGFKHLLSFYNSENPMNWNLSQVHSIINGAEPTSIELCNTFLDEMERYGLKRSAMTTAYGLAEASVAVAVPPRGEEFIWHNLDRNSLNIGGTVIEVSSEHKDCIAFADEGYVVDYCQVRICDEYNKILDEKIIGYIQIKGKNVTSGYYNNPDATAKVLTEDGWIITGDLGFIKNGRIVITGRAKDIIFINGQNYYPHDIERIAEDAYGGNLRYIAACGVFNRVLQKEEIVIFALFKKKLREFIPIASEIKSLITDKMGVTIREVIPVKNVPRTTSGKVQRYKLAESYKAGEYSEVIEEMAVLEDSVVGQSSDDNSTTEKKLMEICCKIFDMNKVDIHDNFLELGGDSILLTKVQDEIEKYYPGKITVTDFFAYPTLAKLAKFIDRKQNIFIPSIVFPQDYFGSNLSAETSALKLSIQGELLHKINDMVRKENLNLGDVLLGLYGYLLSAITKTKQVDIQAMMDKDNQVSSLNFDLTNTTDFINLFQYVDKKLKICEEEKMYPVQDLAFAKVAKESNSLIPFFYKKELYKLNVNFFDRYDIALEIKEMNTQIFITCEYNTGRLKKEKMVEHLNQYGKLIEMVINQYELSTKECV